MDEYLHKREFVEFRRGFTKYKKYKFEIIALIYLTSLVKSYLWYSLFGVDILDFCTINDILFEFIDFSVLFVVLIINYYIISFYINLVTNSRKQVGNDKQWKNELKNIISIIFGFLLIAGSSFFYFKLLKTDYNFFAILLILLIVFAIELKKYAHRSLILLTIYLMVILAPLEKVPNAKLSKKEVAIEQKKHKERRTTPPIGNSKIKSNKNLELYQFNYQDKLIDTELDNYYLVGINSTYFFIYNKELKRTMVIPKNECKNISSKYKLFN